MTDIPKHVEHMLDLVGVKPVPQPGTGHAPVKWPEPRVERHLVSVGWKPSYPGEEPPF